MKFRAKVFPTGVKEAESLVQAFFEESNPNSTISITIGKIEIDGVFEGQPQKIIQTISNCKKFEILYGKESNFEQLISETAETQEKRENSKENEIPELMEIAKKCTSYETFVITIANKLDLEISKHRLFILIVECATQLKKITWTHLDAILYANHQIEISRHHKNVFDYHVENAFSYGEKNVTLLRLLNAIVQYQFFEFGEKKVKQETDSTKVTEKAQLIKSVDTPKDEKSALSGEKTERKEDFFETENSKSSDEDSEKKEWVYFIPSLDEEYKHNPIAVRVKAILDKLGLKNLAYKDQVTILNISVTAVKMKNVSMEKIFFKLNFSKKDAEKANMIFSNFINDYMRKKGYLEKVKVIDFLRIVRKQIVFQYL